MCTPATFIDVPSVGSFFPFFAARPFCFVLLKGAVAAVVVGAVNNNNSSSSSSNDSNGLLTVCVCVHFCYCYY